MIDEAKKLLVKFAELAGDDKDKLAMVDRYKTDIELYESAKELKGNKLYDQTIAELEKANDDNSSVVMHANLFKTTDSMLRQVIGDYQSNLRVINTLKGPELEDVVKNLKASIATLEEEAKINGEENAEEK